MVTRKQQATPVEFELQERPLTEGELRNPQSFIGKRKADGVITDVRALENTNVILDVFPSDPETGHPDDSGAGFRLSWNTQSSRALRESMHVFSSLQNADPPVFIVFEMTFNSVNEDGDWVRVRFTVRRAMLATRANRLRLIQDLTTKLSRYDLLTKLATKERERQVG